MISRVHIIDDNKLTTSDLFSRSTAWYHYYESPPSLVQDRMSDFTDECEGVLGSSYRKNGLYIRRGWGVL